MICSQKMVSRALMFVYILCTVLSCDAQEGKKINTAKDTRATLKPARDTAMAPFKLIELNRKKRLWDCNIITSNAIAEVDSFLQSNIAYYSIDPLPAFDSTTADTLFNKIVTDSKFILVEPSDLLPGNYSFTHRRAFVYDYGDCVLGEFVFSKASNARQHKLYVLINLKAKEVSIWNFENLIVSEKLIDCKIKVKGKLTDYKMRYSITCERFVFESY